MEESQNFTLILLSALVLVQDLGRLWDLSVLIITFSNIMQSQASTKAGMIDSARGKGMCAAYLSVAAIIVALVVAILATGLTIGLFYSYRS
jgi:hypothetical protein